MQTIRGVDVIVTKSPFDAEVALIDVVVPTTIHPIDEAVLDVKINLATDTAVRAGGGGNAVRDKHGMFREMWPLAAGSWPLANGSHRFVNC